MIGVQDVMAWETQGRIAKRHLEKLGTTDKGVIMLRQMLKRELAKVEAGEDPMGVVRDPAKNKVLEFAIERDKAHFTDGFERFMRRSPSRYSPFADDLCKLFAAYNGEQLEKSLRSAGVNVHAAAAPIAELSSAAQNVSRSPGHRCTRAFRDHAASDGPYAEL